jgi:hypothetical protein
LPPALQTPDFSAAKPPCFLPGFFGFHPARFGVFCFRSAPSDSLLCSLLRILSQVPALRNLRQREGWPRARQLLTAICRSLLLNTSEQQLIGTTAAFIQTNYFSFFREKEFSM